MNLRIQIWGRVSRARRRAVISTDHLPDDSDVTVYAVLQKALDDLVDVCDAVEEKFTTARDEFNAANPDRGKEQTV